MYNEAERARREAETANRLKEDFLSTVSHELRTPLNAILGWAAMLRNGVVDAGRSQRAIEAIFNNATRQGRLIEDLLDVSRIVAGRAAIDLQRVEHRGEHQGRRRGDDAPRRQKGVALWFQPQSRIAVTADPRRLEQIFLNLLTNAVKFTPSGGRIDVEVRLSGQSAEVRVVDTGAGIEPAFLPHVFERFRQADSATTRAVEAAWDWGCSSRDSSSRPRAAGSRPKAKARTAARRSSSRCPLSRRLRMAGGRLRQPHHRPSQTRRCRRCRGYHLIVDDEPDAREVMAAALQACGASVVSAASARDALQTLERDEVDLLLSDIAMPGEDGCELIRAIRALPSFQLATIPAAAVTARAQEDERKRALAAGFQMHLSKPLQPAALARAVATLALTRST